MLSIGVCYHARLQEREPYRRAVAPSFSTPCQLPGGHERILQEITRYTEDVLVETHSLFIILEAMTSTTLDDTNTFNRVVIKVVTRGYVYVRWRCLQQFAVVALRYTFFNSILRDS